MLSYIRFDLDSTPSRAERADTVRKDGLSGYGGEMREFLEGVLASYVHESIGELRTDALAPALMVKYGGLGEARAALGDVATIRKEFFAMQASPSSSQTAG